jgi:uncharacterized BrkB/YihY/UPF0761 family membrane protein
MSETTKNIASMLLTVLVRLIGFPFFAALALISMFVLWVKYCKNYIMYGGEAIAYTQKTQRKAISDVFLKIQEQLEKPKN